MPGGVGDKVEVHVTGDGDTFQQQQQQQQHSKGNLHVQLHSQLQSAEDGMARSPSHDSFATDLSLLSLSSSGSDVSRFRLGGRMSVSRMASESEDATAPLIQIHDVSPGAVPCFTKRHHHHHTNNSSSRNSLLQVPDESYGGNRSTGPDTLFEEESDVIRNCSVLSSAVLGLMKSFSTGDISTALDFSDPLRNTVSEEILCETDWNNLEVPVNRRLDYTSRSCSTWVAVGDMQSSTSQLPSPSTRCGSGNIPGFTAADLVRSVNKKVRQMYIRRRLLSTYKALERLTKSQLNLSEALQASGPSDLKKNIQDELRTMSLTSAPRQGGQKTPLTARDLERDRGKPLTKYERNIMIFNWLHNIDDETEVPLETPQQQSSVQATRQQAV